MTWTYVLYESDGGSVRRNFCPIRHGHRNDDPGDDGRNLWRGENLKLIHKEVRHWNDKILWRIQRHTQKSLKDSSENLTFFTGYTLDDSEDNQQDAQTQL